MAACLDIAGAGVGEQWIRQSSSSLLKSMFDNHKQLIGGSARPGPAGSATGSTASGAGTVVAEAGGGTGGAGGSGSLGKHHGGLQQLLLMRRNSAAEATAEQLIETGRVPIKDLVCYLSLLEGGRPEDKLEC